MNVYEVENLTKVYRKGNVTANSDLSFAIRPGDVFGLLGPNGAGKTTLVKQLLGLLAPTSGSIKLMGTEITQNADVVPYYVSCMAQRPTALADLTVREALEVTGRLRMLSRQESRQQAGELIDEFDLGPMSERVILRLSQGQQRLLSLALALVANLPVMILDEPTNDLDPRHRRRLWDKLASMNQTHGTTIILVTHNVIEAERVLHRVGIINHGRIMAMGSVPELKRLVDKRVRLEIALREEHESLLDTLAALVRGETVRAGEGRLVLLTPRDLADEDIAAVLDTIGIDRLDDFRILSPTLEDVYLQLGGGDRLVTATSPA